MYKEFAKSESDTWDDIARRAYGTTEKAGDIEKMNNGIKSGNVLVLEESDSDENIEAIFQLYAERKEIQHKTCIVPYEKILVADVENGNRFETYAIAGERGKGTCCLNGAAAWKGKVGDRLIVMTWADMTADEAAAHVPKVVVLGEGNVPVR